MVGTVTFNEKKVNLPCSGHAVGVGAKRSNQWMQYVVRSGLVVYGGEDIVFGAKGQTRGRSGHSTQYAVE